MGFDKRADFEQKRFDALFGRFDEQLAVIFLHILPQKVETCVDVG